MKKFAGYLALFFLVAALPIAKVWSQTKPFEGTITWTMTMPMMGDEDAHPMIVNVKGAKIETEMDMGAMGSAKTYVDMSSKKGFIVMGKMGYSVDLSSQSTSSATSDSSGLVPTGKKETIAGHSAEEYLLKGLEGGDDMSIWAAADFPKEFTEAARNMLNSNPRQDSKTRNAMNQLAEKGLVPVRIEARKDGDVAQTMEFVKYEEKSLDDALFVPPADIHFTPMPQMGGMH